MQPESRMWRTFLDLSGEVRRIVGDALPGPSLTYRDDLRPQVIRTAHNDWRVINSALTDVENAMRNFSEVISGIWVTNTELTLDAKEARTKVAAASIRTALDERSRVIADRADKITKSLLKSGFPTRPDPHDAAQEAAIAGHKNDLRMVLDSIDDAGQVVNRIGDRLRGAIDNGDDLTVWILATSRWPHDYLESRRIDSVAGPLLDAEIATVLDQFGAAELIEVRSAYTQIKQRHGLGALSPMLGAALGQAVREYEEWRPHGSGQQQSRIAGR